MSKPGLILTSDGTGSNKQRQFVLSLHSSMITHKRSIISGIIGNSLGDESILAARRFSIEEESLTKGEEITFSTFVS
ncbi:hypothetical protein JTE90_018084 [Oedothorax gibbosus]|uniref:Uncharacterized protein n=1 Tax=Oedothorax gibbosus TaxID=931172 RepID=A0AAV6UBP0_9ARAC|nr:hypothetical protein JTE90_018084 [Oedothorax gibbosus]